MTVIIIVTVINSKPLKPAVQTKLKHFICGLNAHEYSSLIRYAAQETCTVHLKSIHSASCPTIYDVKALFQS